MGRARDGGRRGRDVTPKAAACCAWLAGVGFGAPCVYALVHFGRHGEVWTFLGFPTYGGGPFERIGLRTSLPLLGGFLAVCAAETCTGWLLWRRRPVARPLALAILPAEVAFWAGFALPLGFVLGAARTALVLMGRPGRTG
ncbi:hypothetical protein [Streptomyces sp. NRRL F-5727]|uniref:hypothetical protein n=1 Tax=Streptomyces sp. NRRL F-5727 TaxID=1463871 RepID=UPI0006916CDB|nr:hypothetical protein [Streptomyces sp. NRRL F-5727]